MNNLNLKNVELEYSRWLWLQANLPVFVQCNVDIIHGNKLLAVFYWFSEDSSVCTLKLIYECESSFSCRNYLNYNSFGSYCYRSWNYLNYLRTADVDYLQFTGVDLRNKSWTHLNTRDFSADQTFNVGNKLSSFLLNYSLVYHYFIDLKQCYWKPYNDPNSNSINIGNIRKAERIRKMNESLSESKLLDEIYENRFIHTHLKDNNYEIYNSLTELAKKANHFIEYSYHNPTPDKSRNQIHPVEIIEHYEPQTFRPVIYLNTANHLMSPVDNNKHILNKSYHVDYPLYCGDSFYAEHFARHFVPVRRNLIYSLPKFIKRRIKRLNQILNENKLQLMPVTHTTFQQFILPILS